MTGTNDERYNLLLEGTKSDHENCFMENNAQKVAPKIKHQEKVSSNAKVHEELMNQVGTLNVTNAICVRRCNKVDNSVNNTLFHARWQWIDKTFFKKEKKKTLHSLLIGRKWE